MNKTIFRAWFVLAAMLPFVMSSSTDRVPVTDIEYFIHNGKAPENTTMDFPTFLTSTIALAVAPFDTIFNTAEVAALSSGLKLFYEQIFKSQVEYDLRVRSVNVVNQQSNQNEKILDMEAIINVNFRPNPKDQELTNEQYHNILVNLVNKFETQLIHLLKSQHQIFNGLEIIQARNPDYYRTGGNSESSSSNSWLYVLAAAGGVVGLVALVALCFLYRKRALGKARYFLSRGENISPFNQYTESDFPTKETLMMEDETDETFELNPKYAYQPSDPESPVPDHQSSSSRKRAYILPDSDEDLQSESSSTLQRGTRAELWAPAGKLGVAIDVVKGHPIVWRIKDGSPLEGFLKKGDIIVGIDEIDTSRMSAADVTSVMVRRMRQRRKITYVRPDQ